MMWLLRGLRNGVLTTRYPARPDPYQNSFPAAVAVTDAGRQPDAEQVADGCPTGAIQAAPDGRLFVDRGRCILCGACVRARPDLFAWQPGAATATAHRGTLVVPESTETDESLAALRAALAARVRRLRRSVHVRHVDAGSDGSDEWEVNALFNPVYDVARLGIFLTASPRHADLLLVTGAGARGMTEPLRRTLDAMPRPIVVIAAGTDAISGGLFAGSYATLPGVGDTLPVDVWAPGNPASPFTLLHAILLALGRAPTDAGVRR
ncbi:MULTISPECIES: ferredoxin [Micromonospora]|uniref:NADH:ubiquinone oxidoreductase n=1 Tax=Micromonospora solifontis TaxID=2487138 RepID=A0ABX9WC25_9ACTN|nr:MULTISPECIES: ferredoxin [Micromonospora]NES17007.1 NADH:ubiquinone oxidoreductase [Micromonospora sp. PPF5-17B]NES38420.1 NADH:ubiquinone oxidoreductase [Micromonospora solifontis]NES58712.1 NADH:ubiquinone oxidoreductase [Micromonospora sp. PPF5-6]RNL95835.1 NADH:ubiquinone oxidoreductase [Micromonospora solifontis]